MKPKLLKALSKISFLLAQNKKIQDQTICLKKEYYNSLLKQKRGFLAKSALIATSLIYLAYNYTLKFFFRFLYYNVIKQKDPFHYFINNPLFYWSKELENIGNTRELSLKYNRDYKTSSSYLGRPSESYRYQQFSYYSVLKQPYYENKSNYLNNLVFNMLGLSPLGLIPQEFNKLSILYMLRYTTYRTRPAFAFTHMDYDAVERAKKFDDTYICNQVLYRSTALVSLRKYFQYALENTLNYAYRGYIYCANKVFMFDFGLGLIFKIALYKMIRSFILKTWFFFFIEPVTSDLLFKQKIKRYFQLFENYLLREESFKEEKEKDKKAAQKRLVNLFIKQNEEESIFSFEKKYEGQFLFRPFKIESLSKDLAEKTLDYEAKIFKETSRLYYDCFCYYSNLYQKYLSRSLIFIAQYNQYTQFFEHLIPYCGVSLYIPSEKKPLIQTLQNRTKTDWAWAQGRGPHLLNQKILLVSIFIIELYIDTNSCVLFWESSATEEQLPVKIKDQHKLKTIYKGCLDLLYEFISENPFLSIYITRSQWDACTIVCPFLKRCIFGKDLSGLLRVWSEKMDLLNLDLHRDNVYSYEQYTGYQNYNSLIYSNFYTNSLKKFWAYFKNCCQNKEFYWKNFLCYLDEYNNVQYLYIQPCLYYHLYQKIYILIAISTIRLFLKQTLLKLYFNSSFYIISTDLLSSYRRLKEPRSFFNEKDSEYTLKLNSRKNKLNSRKNIKNVYNGILQYLYCFCYGLFWYFSTKLETAVYVMKPIITCLGVCTFFYFYRLKVNNQRLILPPIYNLKYEVGCTKEQITHLTSIFQNYCSQNMSNNHALKDPLFRLYLDSYGTQPLDRDQNRYIFNVYRSMQLYEYYYNENVEYLSALVKYYRKPLINLESTITQFIEQLASDNFLKSDLTLNRIMCEDLFADTRFIYDLSSFKKSKKSSSKAGLEKSDPYTAIMEYLKEDLIKDNINNQNDLYDYESTGKYLKKAPSVIDFDVSELLDLKSPIHTHLCDTKILELETISLCYQNSMILSLLKRGDSLKVLSRYNLYSENFFCKDPLWMLRTFPSWMQKTSELLQSNAKPTSSTIKHFKEVTKQMFIALKGSEPSFEQNKSLTIRMILMNLAYAYSMSLFVIEDQFRKIKIERSLIKESL